MSKIVPFNISGTSVNNNGGRILNGGNIASTRFTKLALGTKQMGYGSRLVSTMTNLWKSLSSGNFATMTAGSYIIRKVTTSLAGVSNTILRSGGSDNGQRHSIHIVTRVRNTFLQGLSWTQGAHGTPSYSFTRSTTDIAYSTDDAATPTQSRPGELTYLATGKTPTNDDYKARTNW